MKDRKSRIIGSHSSSRRDAWWHLVQTEDGTLHVDYENMNDHSDDHRTDINAFLREQGGAGAREKLLSLIERIFEDA